MLSPDSTLFEGGSICSMLIGTQFSSGCGLMDAPGCCSIMVLAVLTGEVHAAIELTEGISSATPALPVGVWCGVSSLRRVCYGVLRGFQKAGLQYRASAPKLDS